MRSFCLILLSGPLAGLLAGCPTGTSTGPCSQDSECAPDLCTRDEQCTPASLTRSVRITWTVRGATANATSCASTPQLYVQVDGPLAQDQVGFAPVPCDQGLFNFDKLPKRFTIAELGLENTVRDRIAIDASNTAHFDLFP